MCNILCRLKLDAKTSKEFKEKIDDEYRVNMYGMPIYMLYLSVCDYPFDLFMEVVFFL